MQPYSSIQLHQGTVRSTNPTRSTTLWAPLATRQLHRPMLLRVIVPKTGGEGAERRLVIRISKFSPPPSSSPSPPGINTGCTTSSTIPAASHWHCYSTHLKYSVPPARFNPHSLPELTPRVAPRPVTEAGGDLDMWGDKLLFPGPRRCDAYALTSYLSETDLPKPRPMESTQQHPRATPSAVEITPPRPSSSNSSICPGVPG